MAKYRWRCDAAPVVYRRREVRVASDVDREIQALAKQYGVSVTDIVNAVLEWLPGAVLRKEVTPLVGSSRVVIGKRNFGKNPGIDP